MGIKSFLGKVIPVGIKSFLRKVIGRKSVPGDRMEVSVDLPHDFDEAIYLAVNADVAAAVSAGQFSSGAAHYLAFGHREGRRLTPVGFVEYLSMHRAKGWAAAPHGRPVPVRVELNDKILAEFLADRPRPELGIAGFEFVFEPPLPQDTPPDAIRVCAADGSPLDFINGRSFAWETKSMPVHRRIRVPIYASPFAEKLMEEEGYTPEERERVRRFAAEGLLKFHLDRADFTQLADRIIKDSAKLYHGAQRFQDGWKHSEAIRELACDPQVARILRLLYGREAIPMQTLNFPVGTEQPTHTDTVHFSSMPQHFMCGVWIALEPITANNGPLHYYPGSHRLPILDYDDIGVIASAARWNENYGYHQDVLRALIDVHGFERQTLLAEAGDAIIWAANLLHGGERILMPGSSRHSQVTHFYFEGCSYYTPSLSNTTLGRFHRPGRRDIRTGMPITHTFEELTLPFAATQ